MATFDKVRDIVVDQLGVEADEVNIDSTFIDDLGADSLDIVELIMAFEEEFSIEIPDEAAEKIGADPARYLYVGAQVNNDVRFGFNLGDESRRKLLNFWNIYVFFNTYAVLDMPNLKDYKLDMSKLQKTDKWLLARLNKFPRQTNSFN